MTRREPRIPTSLARHIGQAATDDAEIRRLIREARKAGVIVFMRSELERLPSMSRALIESEHRRLCGGR